MKIFNIVKKIENWCPLEYKAKNDYCGTEIIFEDQKLQNILLSLDCSAKTIEKAIINKCNLIITHHSFFYPSFWKNLTNTKKINLTKKIKANKITIVSLHTNFDELFLKQALSEKFEVQEIIELKFYNIILLKKNKSFDELIQDIKNKFNLPYLQYHRANNRLIKKIAIVPGAFGSFLDEIFNKNVDLIVGGELKWSDWIHCRDQKQNIVCLGHQSEQLFINKTEQFLKKILKPTLHKIHCHWEKEITIL